MVLKACTHCSLLTEKEQCPECKNPTSSNWSGLLIVTILILKLLEKV